MTLGERIRKARLQAGLSQREIARKSGITVSFLSQVEKNKSTPSLKSLQSIAQALDMKVNLLLGEDSHGYKRIQIVRKGTNEKIILENGESISLHLD